MSLRSGKSLLDPQVSSGGVFLLDTGLVSCSRLLADGRRLGLRLEGGGGLIGGESCLQETSGVEATVLVAGCGWHFSHSVFSDWVRRRPSVTLALARYFAERNAELQTELTCAVRHGIVPRLARVLTRIFDLTDSPAFTITQEELAVILRTQRTTISGAAGLLKARGAISHRRGGVRLLDADRLQSIGCRCGVLAD